MRVRCRQRALATVSGAKGGVSAAPSASSTLTASTLHCLIGAVSALSVAPSYAKRNVKRQPRANRCTGFYPTFAYSVYIVDGRTD